ncbi:hypothetical protein GCM10027046_14740 [Uliginosibacterium flavum]|uniref:DUF4231 domain-containing protein n=1 Tax=Uliginosibacterium flavum TaxID=1396831 RepID=A0ABV2TN83_9RHOO
MTFTIDALGVLQEKGYRKHCHPLDTLSRTFEMTSKNVASKVRFYKWFGFILLTIIPIISALISVLISLKNPGSDWLPAEAMVFPLSLTLTLLTILNSIFKPSEKFREVCLIGIGIERFAVDFMVALERMPKVDESSLLELIDKKRKEFETYQIELIGMFMPMEVAAQQAAAADAKKRHH